MRISSDQTSPDFFRLKGFSRPRIFLDGVEEKFCVAADDEAGIVVSLVLRTGLHKGEFAFVEENGKLATVEKRGRVTIKEKD